MSQLKMILLEDIGYTAWANRELLGVCMELTHEQIERDLGASHGSLLKTFRHIYYSERVWLQRLVANALPPLVEVGDQRLFGDAAPEPALEELVQRWPGVWLGLREWIEQVRDETLAGKMSTLVPNRSAFQLTRWEIVVHAVNHSTLHRGQIVSMLRALGVRPPNTDMFSYYMAR